KRLWSPARREPHLEEVVRSEGPLTGPSTAPADRALGPRLAGVDLKVVKEDGAAAAGSTPRQERCQNSRRQKRPLAELRCSRHHRFLALEVLRPRFGASAPQRPPERSTASRASRAAAR